MLALIDIGKGSRAAQGLKELSGRENGEAGNLKACAAHCIGGKLEIGERADEIRHFERRVLADFNIKDFDRIQARLGEIDFSRRAPGGKAQLGRPY